MMTTRTCASRVTCPKSESDWTPLVVPEEGKCHSKRSRDCTEHQSRRDIERDSLVVDGAERLEGGRVGYEAVVERLVRAQREARLSHTSPAHEPPCDAGSREDHLSLDSSSRGRV